MSTFKLLIDNTYRLLIDATYNLFIDTEQASSPLLKRWNGSKWVLVYEIKVDNVPAVLKRWNGTSWQPVSIV